MTAAAAGLVRVATSAVLEPAGVEVPTRLVWDPADPLAVTVEFRAGRRWVRWVLARDLLAGGLWLPCGAGDVRLEPFVGDLLLTVDNSQQRAVFLVRSPEVRRFLALSYERVPAGAEQVDVDRALALCRRVVGGDR